VKAITTEVLLVGAGPIGLELAVALKSQGVSYVHLEASQIGSTISWFAPGTHFFSSPERIAIAGVPLQTVDQTKATREEYLNYLRGVVQQFDLEIRTYERVSSIVRQPGGGFEVTSRSAAGERLWRASKVILAIGDMHRPRLLDIPGEDLPHVSHYLDEPHTYFRRKILIVGGKNSAVEAAIRCVRVGAQVTMSYRGSDFDEERIKFWLLPEIRGMVRDGRVRFLPNTAVTEIRSDRVILSDGSDQIEVPAEAVLLLTGYEQDPSLFVQAGVRLAGPARQPLFDEATMETNVPGLFVAGTGVAGTQIGHTREFIETTHVHVDRIIAALTGTSAPVEQGGYEMPES
jgi:thioredoxin reductase (NADPH)